MAIRWTEADGIVDLPPLYTDDYSSTASDVSDDGSVVVGRASGPRGSVPVRWTVGGGIETFDRIIDNFDGKIGRASCREREESNVIGVEGEKKTENATV